VKYLFRAIKVKATFIAPKHLLGGADQGACTLVFLKKWVGGIAFNKI